MSTKCNFPGGKVKRVHERCLQNLMITSRVVVIFQPGSLRHRLTNHKITQSLKLPAFSDDYSQQDHSSCGVSVCLCPPAADGKLLWDNPSEVGTYDASCDCYRGSSWGWRNFVKHFDLRRRNYLKNDDLIIFVDFEGQWCSISV